MKKFLTLTLVFIITVLALGGCGGAAKTEYAASPVVLTAGGKAYLVGVSQSFDIVDPRVYASANNISDKIQFSGDYSFDFFSAGNKKESKSLSALTFDVPENFDKSLTVDKLEWLYPEETPTLAGSIGVNDYSVGVFGSWKKQPKKTTWESPALVTTDIDGNGKADKLEIKQDEEKAQNADIFFSYNKVEYSSYETFDTAVTGFEVLAVADLNGDGCMEMIMLFKTEKHDTIVIYTIKYAGITGFVRQMRIDLE